jgi:hypothetical protein
MASLNKALILITKTIMFSCLFSIEPSGSIIYKEMHSSPVYQLQKDTGNGQRRRWSTDKILTAETQILVE